MHDETVQDQGQRDAKSVTIVSGLLLGGAVLLLGQLLLWIADELTGVPNEVANSITLVNELVAVIVLVAYVARHRNRRIG